MDGLVKIVHLTSKWLAKPYQTRIFIVGCRSIKTNLFGSQIKMIFIDDANDNC